MLSVLPKCLDRKCSSSMVGWKGSWCRRSWDELDDVELGVLVPYPEEGREAKDHLRPSALREEAKEKWAGPLGEKLRGLSNGLLPMCPGSGECGRGRVGEVLLRMRLFRLLVLQPLLFRGRGRSFCSLRLRMIPESSIPRVGLGGGGHTCRRVSWLPWFPGDRVRRESTLARLSASQYYLTSYH